MTGRYAVMCARATGNRAIPLCARAAPTARHGAPCHCLAVMDGTDSS
jgi:hypothetical protein